MPINKTDSPINISEKVEIYNSVSELPLASQFGKGVAQVDNSLYVSNGISWGNIIIVPTSSDVTGKTDSDNLIDVLSKNPNSTISLVDGKDYYFDKKVTLTGNQVINCGAARINRPNQVVVTTTTAVTSASSQTFSVDNSAGLLREGQLVVLNSGSNSIIDVTKCCYGYINTATSTSINVTKTFISGSGTSWSGTTYIATTGYVFDLTENSKGIGGIFLGASTPWGLTRWETTVEVMNRSNGGWDNFTAIDIPGEGIMEAAPDLFTMSTALAAGDTVITIGTTNYAKLAVGDWIAVAGATGNDSVCYRVTAKNGTDAITIHRGLENASTTSTIYKLLNSPKYNNISIKGAGGNGIHFSGSYNSRLSGKLEFYRTNLRNSNNHGHEDGCVCWSNWCYDTQIGDIGCYDTALSAFGGLDSVDNSGATIGNVVFSGCTNGLINQILVTQKLYRLRIKSVKGFDNGLTIFGNTNVTNYLLFNSEIGEMQMHNSPVGIYVANGCKFGNITSFYNSTTLEAIDIQSPVNCEFASLKAVGGKYGIRLRSNNTATVGNIINSASAYYYYTTGILDESTTADAFRINNAYAVDYNATYATQLGYDSALGLTASSTGATGIYVGAYTKLRGAFTRTSATGGRGVKLSAATSSARGGTHERVGTAAYYGIDFLNVNADCANNEFIGWAAGSEVNGITAVVSPTPIPETNPSGNVILS